MIDLTALRELATDWESCEYHSPESETCSTCAAYAIARALLAALDVVEKVEGFRVHGSAKGGTHATLMFAALARFNKEIGRE